MKTPEASPSFSIIIPVYNEEAIIVNSVRQNISVLKSAGADYEMIIVNDGSSDRSGALIEQNFGEYPEIRIIQKEANAGFGMAVKSGLSVAKHTYLLCVPADSPLTKEVFDAFMIASSKADIVVSYRIARIGYTPRMRLNSYIYHLLVEIIFDVHFTDFNWIHQYHRKVFDEGNVSITSSGIFMLAEVLIRAQNKGFSFCEIPVAQSERLTGIASASKLSVMIKTLREMLFFLWQFGRGTIAD